MFHILGRVKPFFRHAHVSAAHKRRDRMRLRPSLDSLEQKLMLSVDIAGQWQGTITQPSGLGIVTSYDLDMTLTQSGSSVQGTEKTSTGQYYADITLTGTIDINNVFNFQEGTITQQNTPPGYYWYIKSGNLQISASGGSMSGPWYAGSDSGTIDLSEVSSPVTTTVLTSDSNPSVYGQPVTFTATVMAAMLGSGTPTGTVTFTIDGTARRR